MENPKIIICLAMNHLEKATQHVNTHNTHLEDGVTQEEVIDNLIDSWSNSDYPTYLFPIIYKGIVLIPELAGGSEEQLIYTVHTSVLSSFDIPNKDDIQVYELSSELPRNEELH